MHHGAGLATLLAQAGRPEAQARAFAEHLARDWTSVELEPVDRAMLAYAHQLTVGPGRVGDADVVLLRSAGLDDRSIHDLCAIAAYFAFVNRIADGLGVHLEPRFHGARETP